MTALSWDLCPVYPCGPQCSTEAALNSWRMSHSDIFCAREKCGGPKILFPTLLLKCVLVDSFFRHAFAFRRCCCPALVLNWRLFLHCFCCSSFVHTPAVAAAVFSSAQFYSTELFQASTKRWLSSCPPFFKNSFYVVETDFSTGYFQDPPPSLLHLSWVLGWVMHLLNALANFKVALLYTRVMQLFL